MRPRSTSPSIASRADPVILDSRDPELAPHNIFDSFGDRLERVIWANTETGEIEQVMLDDQGRVAPAIQSRLRCARWQVPGGIRAVKVEDPLS